MSEGAAGHADSPRAAAFLEVDGLRVDLTGSGVNVIEDVGLSVAAGEILGIVGESGSGKTTVATALLAHVRRGAAIVGGAVRVGGVDVLGFSEQELQSARGRRITYVPQDPATALNPALRIKTQLRELIDVHEPDVPSGEREERIAAVLDDVRLPSDPEFLSRYPHQLSGGQQQRVCVAMAFVLRPGVIVLDEPTTGLDVTTQAQILAVIRELCANRGVAAVYVTHDLAVVAQLAHRVAVMYAGRVVEIGPTVALLHDPAHPYTALLTAAIPDVAIRKLLQPISGQAPSLGSRPTGCAFAARCPLAIERCVVERPLLTTHSRAHASACHRPAEVHSLRRDTPAPVRIRVSAGQAPVLSVRGLACSYGSHCVLDDVSLSLESGECLAIVGESGSGKTTLARTIVGLNDQRVGVVELNGHPLAPLARARSAAERQAIQFVFQNPYASLNPRKMVGQILLTVVRHFFPIGRAEARARVEEALESVSLPARVVGMYPDQLSGGERQRVAVARALACGPTILVCDEITSALDVSVQAAIVALLQRLRTDRNLSMLFVTHDLALVRSIADRVAVLNGGRIVEIGSTDTVLDRPNDAYTRQLLEETPSALRRAGSDTGAGDFARWNEQEPATESSGHSQGDR